MYFFTTSIINNEIKSNLNIQSSLLATMSEILLLVRFVEHVLAS